MRGLPVARPKLPEAAQLLPYLREIDAARRYTNHGPLARRFESALATHVEATGPGQIAVVSSGTAALTAILMSFDCPPGSYCIVPAWTFAATAHAAVQAGFIPWFVDVEPFDGALSPAHVLRLTQDDARTVGGVVVVAPFGAPIDTRAWEVFRRTTGIPVALDAAAGFDAVRVSAIPTAVSLHATKVLGVGEGGFVACSDDAGATSIRACSNFGFSGTREATARATNAKLSEYAAAVGLAALKEWPARRPEFVRVAAAYRRAFAGSAVRVQPGYGTRFVSSTTIVEVPAVRLTAIERALAAAGIESRRWWEAGVARQRAFAAYPRSALPTTEHLAASVLGLPCWPELDDRDISRVADIVAREAGVAENARRRIPEGVP